MVFSTCCFTGVLVQAVVSLWSHSSSSSNSSNKSDATEVAPNTLIDTFPRAPVTSDSIRLKCREMIANALQTGGNLLLVLNLYKQAPVACTCPFPHCRLKYFQTWTHIFFPQTIILPSVLIVMNSGHRLKNISLILLYMLCIWSFVFQNAVLNYNGVTTYLLITLYFILFTFFDIFFFFPLIVVSQKEFVSSHCFSNGCR